MNIDRILNIADLIEAQPHTSYEAQSGFSMEALTHESCYTPCCIAGWVTWEIEGRPKKISLWDVSISRVGEYLDIEFVSTYLLCYPHDYIKQLHWNKITPAQAASVLRNLARTGEVDWSSVAKELENA
jgi:hypothetical protein